MIRKVTRIAPPPPVEGGFGPWARTDNPRRCHPELDEWICQRILVGWTPQAIVAAIDGRLSIRSIYRWRKDLRGLEVVEIGGYRATFALRRHGGPSRLTTWERVIGPTPPRSKSTPRRRWDGAVPSQA